MRLKILSLLLATFTLPIFAGSSTAESVRSEKDALRRAMRQVPEDATVTSHKCRTFQVGGEERYRCTVYWKYEEDEE